MAKEERDYDAADEKEAVHPALRNFSRTTFMIKHIAKKVVMGLVIGAAVGAAVLGVGAVALTALTASSVPFGLGWLGVGGGLLTVGGQGFAASMLSGAAVLGAQVGGVLGLTGTGLMAMSSSAEAADAEEDRLVAKFEQAAKRRNYMASLERGRDEQKAALEAQTDMIRSKNLNQGLPAKIGQQGQAYS